MARKKKDADVMEEYTTEITYVCPKRGKVTERVKVKKYKSAEKSYLQEVNVKDLIEPEEGFQIAEDTE